MASKNGPEFFSRQGRLMSILAVVSFLGVVGCLIAVFVTREEFNARLHDVELYDPMLGFVRPDYLKASKGILLQENGQFVVEATHSDVGGMLVLRSISPSSGAVIIIGFGPDGEPSIDMRDSRGRTRMIRVE